VLEAEKATEPKRDDEKLSQVFDNTFWRKILQSKRRRREVFAYGVDNEIIHQDRFRKIRR